MKRFYLVVMVLLSSLSYSQTYTELMRIVEKNDFKRVMIENNFQLDSESELDTVYGLDMVKDRDGENLSFVRGYYSDIYWNLKFIDTKRLINRYGNYEDITDTIKRECNYRDIFYVNGRDYVVYECDESKFDGYIGFVISENIGYIRYFPKKFWEDE